MKFKKISQGERACVYGLTEDVSSAEWAKLVDWLDVHCPDSYDLGTTYLFIDRRNELFFELTFPTI